MKETEKSIFELISTEMREHGVKISTRTVRGKLLNNGYKAYHPEKKPKFTKAMWKKR